MTDAPATTLQRTLGLRDAVALFVGIILGSGIFVAPAAVAQATANPLVAAGLWATGGLVALAGAITYAESGARLPHTGGFYIYYRAVYGLPVAFVGGWVALLVTYPASLAAIALLCARYVGELVPAMSGYEALVAAGAVVLAMGLNVVGLHTGGRTQVLLSATKVLALLVLALAAVVGAAPSVPHDVAASVPTATPLALLGAVVVLLWTYDGWSDVALVAGEVRSPEKNLLRAVLLGTAVLVGLYVIVQLAVMRLLPASVAAASPRVLADAVESALGPRGGALVALLVVVATFGSLHGIVMTSSRLAFAMAEDQVFLPFFAKTHRRWGTPARAVAAIGIATLFYLAAVDFDWLLSFFSFSVWLFYGLTAVALLRLRRRRVGEPLPYRPRGALVAPWVLIAVAIGMTTSLALASPRRALIGLAAILAALPVYALWRHVRRAPS